jgi:hypothetical protein
MSPTSYQAAPPRTKIHDLLFCFNFSPTIKCLDCRHVPDNTRLADRSEEEVIVEADQVVRDPKGISWPIGWSATSFESKTE